MVVQKTQDHLMKQDASTVDPSKLTALSPEVVRFELSNVVQDCMVMLLMLLHWIVLLFVFSPIFVVMATVLY